MTKTWAYAAGVVIILVAIAGNAYLGVSSFSKVNSLASQSNHIAHTALGAAAAAATSSAQSKQSLADFEGLSAERRAENKRTLARLDAQTKANHELALKVERLSAQRAADASGALARETALTNANRQEVSALAAAQATLTSAQQRITALQASQHHASAVAEFNTCTQVEAVKSAVRFTLTTIFAGQHLTPSQQRKFSRILAQFKPRTCVKP